MARPKAELPPAASIRRLADAEGRLALRVTPGARTETLTFEAGRLLVKVRAKPHSGAANRAALDLLARALGLASSCLQLEKGASSRDKLVRVLD